MSLEGGHRASAAQDALQACERQIGVHEARVRAWAWLDLDRARAQAQALDERTAQLGQGGGSSPPLLGCTVGLKDIIDTADMPTENGTVLHAGRRPAHDAALVTRLRNAGAVVLGKTVTTELATYAPGVTTNPWNAAHTPGGSSSGSAAAVACGMADLAIGSQTNGSTIRPASFCGVVGFKPGRDRIDRTGMLVQSPTFDTVGLFARDVESVQRLYAVLASSWPAVDVGAGTEPPGSLPPLAAAALTVPGTLMFWETSYAARLEPGARAVLEAAAHRLGAQMAVGSAFDLSAWIDLEAVVRDHGLIMEAEIARSFADEYARGQASLSASLRGQIERGRATDPETLQEAVARLHAARARFDSGWPAGCQALLMPAASGEAPLGLGHTGDPIFCTMATALDLPAINVPGLRGPQGLPVGLQLLGRRGAEAELLQHARAVEQVLAQPE